MSPSNRSRGIAITAIVAVLAMFAAIAGVQAAPPAPDQTAATRQLERAIELQGWSASLLHELGSSYLESGEHGRAILALERARLLDPRDPVIAEALDGARAAAGVVAPEQSRLRRAASVLTTDEWTWIALGAGVLACIGTVALTWGIRRSAGRALAIAGTISVGIAAAAAVIAAPSPDRAIVVADELARLSPFPSAEVAFEPVPGETVQIERSRGDFLYVRSGDRAGWMSREAVARIIPAT